MEHEIVSATPTEDGQLRILVDSEHATSFHEFLRAKGVNCSDPSGAIFQPERLTKGIDGRLRRYDRTVVHAIIADGTMEEFTDWCNEWLVPGSRS